MAALQDPRDGGGDRVRMSAECAGAKDDTPTFEYYERGAELYFQDTLRIDLSALYERFLPYLPAHASILDAGSGSGRDTFAFLRRGYVVDAFDSSPGLCKLSTRLTGVNARILRFQEFEDVNRYDGIWACASLLHLQETELPDAIGRLVRALNIGGALYMSFKHGLGARVAADDRFFTDMDAERLQRLLAIVPGQSLEELWISAGEDKVEGQGDWLNAIIIKRAKAKFNA